MNLPKSDELPACVILAETALGHTLGMVRSLGRKGVPVHVLVIAWFPWAASIYKKSRYCKTVHPIASSLNAQEACDRVLRWSKSQAFTTRPVLIPTTDRTCTYVAECRDQYSEHFELCMADNHVVLGMLDKHQAHSHARNAGLRTPEIEVVAGKMELDRYANTCTFPVIVKPIWERTNIQVFNATYCNDPQSLLNTGDQLIGNGASVLIQQYVPGGDNSVEVYMFYRTRNGCETYGCTGRKLRQIPPRTGCMASGESVVLPHVERMSQNLLRALDYRGLGGIEYKRNQGESYFIEMSVRPEGFHMLASKAGVDLPWLAYSDMVWGQRKGKPINQKHACYINVRSHISLWHKHGKRVPALREILRVLRMGHVEFDLWNWKDPLPWLAATRQWMAELLTRLKTALLRRNKSMR